jgi:hypothetical protein
MVEYLTGADFIGACEIITGEAAPRGPKGKGVDKALMATRRAAAEAEEKKRQAEDNEFRTREIARAHRIWADAGPISGSVAESYLRFRAVQPHQVRSSAPIMKLPYWHNIKGEWRIIHEGPAMVAAIQGPDGKFIGSHITYIDGAFLSRSGKATIVHPETGEILDAKKGARVTAWRPYSFGRARGSARLGDRGGDRDGLFGPARSSQACDQV